MDNVDSHGRPPWTYAALGKLAIYKSDWEIDLDAKRASQHHADTLADWQLHLGVKGTN
jgi:hypothetical protein